MKSKGSTPQIQKPTIGHDRESFSFTSCFSEICLQVVPYLVLAVPSVRSQRGFTTNIVHTFMKFLLM
jgi:hypothetical protein